MGLRGHVLCCSREFRVSHAGFCIDESTKVLDETQVVEPVAVPLAAPQTVPQEANPREAFLTIWSTTECSQIQCNWGVGFQGVPMAAARSIVVSDQIVYGCDGVVG